MIACSFVADGCNGDDDTVFDFIVVQYAAGAEQHKFFRAHSNDFFKAGDAGGSAYSGQIKSNINVIVSIFINGKGTVCCV